MDIGQNREDIWINYRIERINGYMDRRERRYGLRIEQNIEDIWINDIKVGIYEYRIKRKDICIIQDRIQRIYVVSVT